jgi:BirA family biotin operon repressor/biotin-[acetyl-CoA-carboxylase] ligase
MNKPADLEALAERILPVIRAKPGRTHSLKHLSKRFRASEQEIGDALRLIAEWKYRLKADGSEVTFLGPPDLLTATEVGYGLKTKTLGRTIHAYRSVKSTNDLAAQLAAAGAPEGTIVTAEEQTKGRGRYSRDWHSPPHAGIYVSIVLRPTFQADRTPGLSIMTALALADTLEPYCPGRVRIKWPNDVLISGRKAAGILTELSAERQRIEHVILGVGINVNQRAEDFPAALRTSATSLRRVTRRKRSRVELLQRFLLQLEKEYAAYRRHGLQKSRSRSRRYSSLIGTRVILSRGREIIEGMAVDIDSDGSLLVRTDLETVSVSSGEVTVITR